MVVNRKCFVCVLLMINLTRILSTSEEDEDVKYANRCEVCKVVATELEQRLQETGKTHEVIETGYSLDDVKPKKKKPYQKSELRLVESLEGICDRILEYNIHKERTDSTRFAKGMSQTFRTLHGLVDKGVKVELGIPYELWDKPSVEITNMKMQCEALLENSESDIEDWYWNFQNIKSLQDFLCKDIYLKNHDSSCLNEKLKGDSGNIAGKTKTKTKSEL
ncbi:protein canopy homolog 3 [Agrilus planipennis]|uniref:Protein canopy homolog 3 n=1 Tax=Agrilus planipennis TaxID=224129 RepID=A0A1W4X238_AGRPL|nr:protein canopy homolog 3 [Agrilus planipennis]XP_018326463.1 protein canopy homolog 3 [Agrilus planipennis]